MNTRSRHIDIARGIAILLVVFGHGALVIQSFFDKGKLWEVIYSFHIPLFFFLSGVLFKPEQDLNYLVMRKADSVLKPYFVVLSLLSLVLVVRFVIVTHPAAASLLTIIGYSVHVLSCIIGYFFQIIYGIGNLLPLGWGALWFLPHLWVLFIFSYAFLKAVRYDHQSILIKSVFLLILLLIGYFTIGLFGSHEVVIASSSLNENGIWLTEHGTVIPNVAGVITSIDSTSIPHHTSLNGLPFSIDIICLTAFYFLCGFTMREKVFKINNIRNGWLLLLIATTVFASLHYFFNYRADLNARFYNNVLVCTAEALSGIFITLVASCIISRTQVLGKVLAYIGTGTLFIMLFHFVIQNYVYDNLHKAMPFHPYLSSFIAFPVAICVPLLLWEIVKRNHYLSLLLLPLKSSKTLQTAGEEQGI